MGAKKRVPKDEIFFSHSSQDRPFVDRTVRVLRGHGLRVWYSSTNIVGGKKWHDEIGKALKQFPWFDGTMARSIPDRPSRQTSFPSRGGDHPMRLFSLWPSPTPACSQCFLVWQPLERQSLSTWKRPGVPSSLGTLRCCALLWTPARPTREAYTAGRCGPTYRERRGFSTMSNFGARSHGIGTRCLRFAVRIAPTHARLASGCWPALPDGIDYPQSSDERFP